MPGIDAQGATPDRATANSVQCRGNPCCFSFVLLLLAGAGQGMAGASSQDWWSPVVEQGGWIDVMISTWQTNKAARGHFFFLSTSFPASGTDRTVRRDLQKPQKNRQVQLGAHRDGVVRQRRQGKDGCSKCSRICRISREGQE
jgi:hypothetical protein